MPTLRNLFKNFKYSDSNEFDRDICEHHVFFNDEIERYSLKWLKRLMLVRVGLSSSEQLEKEIYRYPMAEYKRAVADCLSLARKSDRSNQEYIIVLKSIPMDATGMIPNFRIYSADEVVSVFSGFWSQNKGTANEIWFCKTDTQKKFGNLGGRITYNRTSHPEVIEIVWFTSPRRIEEAHSPDFQFPFWRAVKELGSGQFKTQHLYIPNRYSADLSERELLLDAQQILQELSRKQENIDQLNSILYASGAKEVSLEFIKENGRLKFIDWDSDVEYELYKKSS